MATLAPDLTTYEQPESTEAAKAVLIIILLNLNTFFFLLSSNNNFMSSLPIKISDANS